MDRAKYTTISHRGLTYASPVSVTKMEGVVEMLELPAGASILDLGAGKAELSIRLIERYGARAIALERATEFVAEARAQAATRVPAGSLTLVETDAVTYAVDPSSLDLAICIGATEIHGGHTATLRTLTQLVRPGGLVLVGEGYWKREPAPEYLEALGAARDEFTTHADNVAAGTSLGLLPLHALVASDDDWDEYEWRHARAVERWAIEHPDDPDRPALLTRIRAWRDTYLRWGRDTLGFGLYLFERPQQAQAS